MNIKKRTLSFAVILCIFISMFPISLTASAESYVFDYYVENGEVCITHWNTKPVGDVVIPDEIEGFPVTAIQWEAFSYCSEMTSIYIPNTVNYIGQYAFWGCSSLETIRLPASLKSVYSGMFYRCTNLKEIYIPKSIEYISGDAFNYCPNIETIIVEEGNEYFHGKDNALINQEKILLLLGKNNSIPNDGSVTTLYYTFVGRSDITEIVIPDCIIGIFAGSFKGCMNLEKIAIPNSVTFISPYAFEGCSNLTSIYIPESVEDIYSEAFNSCENLTDIYCGAESKPEGWRENWCDSSVNVHWNYNTRGDIDGDGEISVSDYIIAKRAVMQTMLLDEVQSDFTDVDRDGTVTVDDYVLIKRHVMGTYVLV